MKKTEYNYLSPDGITITMDWYATEKEANNALKNWMKRFEMQGYYSSNRGRIALDLLQECCKLVID